MNAPVRRPSLIKKLSPGDYTAPAKTDPAGRLKTRFQRAEQLKAPWLDVFEECFEYALPGKQSMFSASPGERRMDRIFDETAVVGVQEFASRLQAGIMPTFSRWTDLRAGSDVPKEERKEVDEALDTVTDHVFEILQHSNLDQEVSEAFLDVSVGTGCIDVLESVDPMQPIRFAAAPLAVLYIDVGPDDRVDFIARRRTIRASNLKFQYKRVTMSDDLREKAEKDQDCPVEIIEVSERDWSETEETWVFTAFEAQACSTVYTERESGIGSGRSICFRWSKLGGEVWGRGPLLNAMPAIKTCNLTMELLLENAEMAMSGIYTAEDDGALNVETIQLVPGTIIPIAPGSKMQNLGPAGNFDVSQLVLQDMRMNIKKALYNDMLGNPDKTPASATEISARMADLSRQIGSAFGRLQHELVQPLLQRVIYILKKQGRIQLPAVNGRMVKIVPTSPLSQAQEHQDVQMASGYIGMVGQLFGPQLVNVLIKSEDAADYLADKVKFPSRLMRSATERKAIVQQIAQAAQGQAAQPEASPSAGPPPAPV